MKRSRATLLLALVIMGACVVANGQMSIGCNLWNVGWTGTAQYFTNNGNPGWTTTTNPWRPDFITDMAPYKTIRYADWCGANSQDPPGVWSQRTQKTADQSQSNGTAVAYEWMIDLCNRTNCDLWLCVPYKADSNYCYQLALLVNSTLNSNLKIYLEYSNETWNTLYVQATYCQTQGTALNLAGSSAALKGHSYCTYASVRQWEQFEKVFGKDSPRLIKVIAGHSADQSVARQKLLALDDTVTVNPHRVRANAIGIAPYMDGANVAECRAGLTARYGEARVHYNVTHPRGLQLVCYEAGIGVASSAFETDPALYQLLKDYFGTLSRGGINGTVNYLYAVGGGSWSWGAKITTGQSEATAHKWRAIRDWNAAHPVGVRQLDSRTCLTPARQPSISVTPAMIGVRFGGYQTGLVSLLRIDGRLLQDRMCESGGVSFVTAGYGAGACVVHPASGNASRMLVR
jgi:hypothetical protein